jgi:hypothetical protein
MAPLADLELLIRSRYPLIAVETLEEDRLERLLGDAGARLGLPVFVWTVTTGLRRLGHLTAIYDSAHPVKALNNVAAMAGEAGVYLLKGIHRHLGEPEVVRRLLDLVPAFKDGRRAIILCGIGLALPPELRAVAASFTLALPSVAELRALTRRVLDDLGREGGVRVSLAPEEFERLVERLRGFTAFEAERALTKAALRDAAVTGEDLAVLAAIRKEMLEQDGVLEFFAAEEPMADVGGLASLKGWLVKRRDAYTPRAREFGIAPPRGVLLLGVQGCGKTLVARTIAHEWGLPFLKLEAGRLYDKYVGESDKNLEKALQVAEHMAPCVLMIDEIEKAFAYSGSADSDGGLSRRLFGRLLGWLQDRAAPVFVVATCNAIHGLPPEMTRKGRFDEIFFIDLPDAAERAQIFAIHLRKRKRDPEAFDLDGLAAASDGFSGAEIEQAVVSALYTAFAHRGELTTALLADELASTKPLSVTRREEIESLRAWARGRTVGAR